jgi:hypothetical protein
MPLETTPTSTPTPTYSSTDYDGANPKPPIIPSPVVVAPSAPRVYTTATTAPTYSTTDYDGDSRRLPAPIIPIIVTPTPIITGGGFGGGGFGGSSSSKVVAEKPNFIKKNILPILLAGSAIYVLIKKPI